MGQRSQIYIKYKNKYTGKVHLVAMYFQWCYGTRMISRARHGIEWMQRREGYVNSDEIRHIFETNFDMRDCVLSTDIIGGLEGSPGFRENVFFGWENNDGKLFVDVTEDGIKYCFTDCEGKLPLDGVGYMKFDTADCYDEYKWGNVEYMATEEADVCIKNIAWLKDNATLMTKKELDGFIYTKFEEAAA